MISPAHASLLVKEQVEEHSPADNPLWQHRAPAPAAGFGLEGEIRGLPPQLAPLAGMSLPTPSPQDLERSLPIRDDPSLGERLCSAHASCALLVDPMTTLPARAMPIPASHHSLRAVGVVEREREREVLHGVEHHLLI